MTSTARLVALMLAIGFLGSSLAYAGEPKPLVAGNWLQIQSDRTKADDALIVHLWGLTCAPCRVEMPEWAKLHSSKPATRIVFIHAERAPAKLESIAEFLMKSGLAEAENWYFADRFVDRLRYEIDPDWRGEMPMTLLISRNGKVKTIIGSADIDEVRQWIETESRDTQR